MAGKTYTAIDLSDGITTRLAGAKAIIALAQAAHDSDEIPDTAIPEGLFAARQMIDEAEELTDKLFAIAKQAGGRNA